MGHDIQRCEERTGERKSHAFSVVAPCAHAGIGHALDASYGKPAALPEDLRRLLDRLG